MARGPSSNDILPLFVTHVRCVDDLWGVYRGCIRWPSPLKHYNYIPIFRRYSANIISFPPPSSSPSFSLLHLVCGLGQEEATEFLLGPKVKADPNAADNSEELSPLHAAAMAGSPGCVEILLEHGERGGGLMLPPPFGKVGPGCMLPPLIPLPVSGADPVTQSSSGSLPADLVPRGEGGSLEACKEARELLDQAAGKKGGARGKSQAAAAAKKKGAGVKPSGSAEEPFEIRFGKLSREEQLRKVIGE